MRIIQETDPDDKKVLVRVDYNVPVKNGRVVNNEKIAATIKTINFLVQNGASVVLCSHLGRPDGKIDSALSLAPIVKELEGMIDKNVQFCSDCIGPERNKKLEKLYSGDILLLENLRFYKEEEANDPVFSQKLVEGCDFYINDAFSVSHRSHASVVGVTKLLKSYAGYYLQEEVQVLSKLLKSPAKPFVLILGGAKIKDKIGILEHLMDKVDTLILGGAIANTFLLAHGLVLGKSVVEPEAIGLVNRVMALAKKYNVKVLLPKDVMVAGAKEETTGEEKDIENIAKDDMALDIGEKTLYYFSTALSFAETIFWNGPMGYAENKTFAKGTDTIGDIVASCRGFSIVGGGDTITSLDTATKKKFGYVSMAGGASLDFLSGEKLPGLEVLE